MSSYKVSEPSALKFLKANGAVVDENGNVINDASDYWKKVYDQAEPKVAKYLHADGTIDENPGSGGSGADLEDNKEVSITENGTIEITPTEGKDGMKKVTATVNVASSGTPIYAWVSEDGVAYLNIPSAYDYVQLDTIYKVEFQGGTSWNNLALLSQYYVGYEYTKVSDTEFTLTNEDEGTLTFTRDSTKDEVVSVWDYTPDQ